MRHKKDQIPSTSYLFIFAFDIYLLYIVSYCIVYGIYIYLLFYLFHEHPTYLSLLLTNLNVNGLILVHFIKF